MNLITKQADAQTQKTNLQLPKRKGGGKNQNYEINRCTIPYIKQVNNKALAYSTGNYIQHLVINYSGKESKKENIGIQIYMYKQIISL